MKSAIVTGAGAGIGEAICDKLAHLGYRVGVLDRDLGRAAAVAARLPHAMPLNGDVANQASIAAALHEFSGVPDLLVNNAGIVRFGRLDEQTPDMFRETVTVNLMGTFNCAWAVAAGMIARGSGVIVNMTSINALTPGPNAGGYPASKAAVAALTAQMATEWGPLGLRVNAVAPGFIDGGMSAPIYANDAVRQSRGSAVPMKKLGTPADIANAVAWLASDEASYVNGHHLVVDGGVVNSLLAQLPRF